MDVQIRGVIFTWEAIIAPVGPNGQPGARGGILRDDFLPFLTRLKAAGRRTAIVAPAADLPERLAGAAAGARFDVTVPTASWPPTPETLPQAFRQCQERLELPPDQLLIIAAAGSACGRTLRLDLGTTDGRPGRPFTLPGYGAIDLEHLDRFVAERLPVDPWRVTQDTLRRETGMYWETIFALSNGYMGLRGAQEEPSCFVAYPATYINGIFGFRPYRHELPYPGVPVRLHAALNLFDWRAFEVSVGGEALSLDQGTLHEFRRTLDLARGILTRTVTWGSPGGRIIRLCSERLISMSRTHVGAIRYELTPLNFSGPVVLRSVIRLHNRNLHFTSPGTRAVHTRATPGHSVALCRTAESDFTVGLSARHRVEPDGAGLLSETSDPQGLEVTVRAELAAGSPLALSRFVACYTDLDAGADRVLPRAAEDSLDALTAGFERLKAEQADFWRGFWDRADVRIQGNDQDQLAVRYALFQLRQSCPDDGRRSISANGLTGDAYMGHIFWDTEIYMIPFFLHTEPRLARALLLYRNSILDQARRRAGEMAGPGALFAWQSISGEECAIVHEASTAQYHLNSDIAYAICAYVQCTGDMEFLRDAGAEIVFETARFLFALGRRIPLRDNRFCLNVVCGPDEYACGVDNNCYTNLMARFHFRFAHETWRRLQEAHPDALARLSARIHLTAEEIAAWREAAEDIYVPFNDRLQIHAQDDSYLFRNPADMDAIPRHRDIRWDYHPLNLWRLQVSKQADVVLMTVLLGDQFPPRIKKNDYDFYEPRTNHGSSLSPGVHAIAAAELGYDRQAYDYFRQTAWMDLDDLKGNTDKGLHSASLGNTWLAIASGFGGMRAYSSGLQFEPRLPPAWQAYSFQILYRGCRLRITVTGQQVLYELREGDGLPFRSWGEPFHLDTASPRAAQPLPPPATRPG